MTVSFFLKCLLQKSPSRFDFIYPLSGLYIVISQAQHCALQINAAELLQQKLMSLIIIPAPVIAEDFLRSLSLTLLKGIIDLQKHGAV